MERNIYLLLQLKATCNYLLFFEGGVTLLFLLCQLGLLELLELLLCQQVQLCLLGQRDLLAAQLQE